MTGVVASPANGSGALSVMSGAIKAILQSKASVAVPRGASLQEKEAVKASLRLRSQSLETKAGLG